MPGNKIVRSLVIIPVKDEAAHLENVIKEIMAHLSVAVLVVDDNSKDFSAAVAENAGAKVLRLDITLGPWGAIQTGFRFALSRGYDVAATMDGDGQHIAEFLPGILAPVLAGKADVAVGTFTERLTAGRRAALRIFQFLGNLDFPDITSGMRAYSRKAMKLLTTDELLLLDYPDFGIFTYLNRNRLKLIDIPVKMRNRTMGKSRVFRSPSAIAMYLFYTYLLLVAKRR